MESSTPSALTPCLDHPNSDDETNNSSSEGEEECSLTSAASGSTLTVKFQAGRNPLETSDDRRVNQTNQRKSFHVPEIDYRAAENVDYTVNDTVISTIAFKPVLNTEKGRKTKRRPTLCYLLCGVVLIILFTALCLGIFFWKGSTESLWTLGLTTARLNHTTAQQTSSDTCNYRSSLGYFTNIFHVGYDIYRSNPLRNRGYSKTIFDRTALKECKLLSIDSCQPEVRSKVIDSLDSYRDWLTNHIVQSDRSTTHELPFNDDEVYSLMADLTTANQIIISEIHCKILEIHRDSSSVLDSQFLQRMALLKNSDQDTFLEFLEDFGTHYVQQAQMGASLFIKFSLNTSSVTGLTLNRLNLENQANLAAKFILSRANYSNLEPNEELIALNFIENSHADVYPSISILNSNWIDHAVKHPDIIQLELKPISDLFSHVPNGGDLIPNYGKARENLCISQGKGLGKCSGNHTRISKNLSRIILPVISLNNDSSTVHADAEQCSELCRLDPLCSVSNTVRRTECTLHRQWEFQNFSINPLATSSVEIRNDLRPVILHGLTVRPRTGLIYEKFSSRTYEACLKACQNSPGCQISVFEGSRNKCYVVERTESLELLQDPESSITFLIGVVKICSTNPGERCPVNSQCWNGLCVCETGFKNHGGFCYPYNSHEETTNYQTNYDSADSFEDRSSNSSRSSVNNSVSTMEETISSIKSTESTKDNIGSLTKNSTSSIEKPISSMNNSIPTMEKTISTIETSISSTYNSTSLIAKPISSVKATESTTEKFTSPTAKPIPSMKATESTTEDTLSLAAWTISPIVSPATTTTTGATTSTATSTSTTAAATTTTTSKLSARDRIHAAWVHSRFAKTKKDITDNPIN